MRLIFLSVLLLLSVSVRAQTEQQTSSPKSVEERLAELEANQNLRYISLSGFLISSYDHIAVSETYPRALDHNDLQYARLRFSLNADAELNPQLKVYTRLTATKFMNNWRSQGGTPYYIKDIEGVYSQSGSEIHLEKAYVDLSCPASLWTLSVGRLPTVNGSPEHFWDVLPRQGTYPLLTFDAPLDGVGVTYRADSHLPMNHELSLRALYTPFMDVSWNGMYKYLMPPKEDTTGGTPSGSDTDTMIKMWALQADYSLKDQERWEDLTAIVQYYQGGPLPFSSGAGTSDLNIEVNGLTGLLEVMGIAQTGLDVSLSHTYTNAISDGQFAPGLGFGTDKNSGSNQGSITLLSTRYRWATWALGLEWLSASNVPFYFSAAPEDLTRFYSTPGSGEHLYVTKKIFNLVTARMGYRQQDLQNYPITFGPVASTDRQVKTYYLNLRTDF
ncbi:DUF3373 family protein [Bdellovibrio bacteriovorus]|uniref:DUF3373 family protein n=1 Tax=Bdellovibrio bacteriovorus TaxID=959 RepID=UPI0021CDEEE2|nr:DUF3373 family protein [Bdellovibrio bacteriovorus]UXR64954.1 DUF3373 family protein [Bdellovibrio bacteriovorus]